MEEEAKHELSGLSAFLVLKFRKTVREGTSEDEKWVWGILNPLLLTVRNEGKIPREQWIYELESR